MDSYPLLDALSGPQDLKALDSDGLKALADELRRGLIQTISRVGGHFAPPGGIAKRARPSALVQPPVSRRPSR